MTFNELDPIIQSWIDSDEFIDSLVSVVKEFNLPGSTPLTDSIFGLILKTTAPEEFKAKLLASLPPEKQTENLITRLVSLSLLPIKNPLAESGIDISVIVPLDSASAVPYNPDTKLTEEQDEATEAWPAEKQGEITKAAPTAPIVESSPTSTPISPIESASVPVEQSPPALDKFALLAPNFEANTESPSTPLPTEESAPAPFIIHKEKPIPQVSINSHKESLLRPMFYSGGQEIKGSAPTVSVEFGETENVKKISSANIVDLSDSSL